MRVKTFVNRFGMICIVFALCTVLCINTGAADIFHWYCKRTADHSQPTLDSNMQWISEFGGIYLDNKHVLQEQDKVIYLTFDVGYENDNVVKILDTLYKHQICGAFFILGNLIQRSPDLVKRMSDEGHLVCNHTYTHKNITALSANEIKSELQRLEDGYMRVTGKQMSKYFRPPEGTFDRASLKAVAEYGYKTVFWSFAYADWDNNKQMNKEVAKKKIMDNVHNGEIMLLHPTSETNAQVLEDVICELKSLGYRFGTLDELDFDVP